MVHFCKQKPSLAGEFDKLTMDTATEVPSAAFGVLSWGSRSEKHVTGVREAQATTECLS